MDEIGVLVERIGFKAHTKSAPIAQLKKSNLISTNGFPQNIGIPPKSDFVVDDLDHIFRTDNININATGPTHTSGLLDDTTAGLGLGLGLGGISSSFNAPPLNQGIIDLESFSFTKSTHSRHFNPNDDLLTSMPWKTNGIDDLLHQLGSKPGIQSDVKHNGSKSNASDLIPDFGIATTTKERGSNVKVHQPSSSQAVDPFLVFEQTKPDADASWPFFESEPLQPNGRSGSVQSTMDDELERLGRVTKIRKEETVKESNLDDIFGAGPPATSISKPISKKDTESQFERSFPDGQKPTSVSFMSQDLSSIFEDGVNLSGPFKNIDGESDEQRRRRWNTHIKTQERMAKALADKKQRDVQTIQEQEERHRFADSVDNNIKKWAAGKEGNMRALLSSLQDVLWEKSGWQAIALTGLMETRAVKKAHYKATLYLHPDKVQQKGFTPQQKYIAEKVFHLLMEAYKKFEAEELR